MIGRFSVCNICVYRARGEIVVSCAELFCSYHNKVNLIFCQDLGKEGLFRGIFFSALMFAQVFGADVHFKDISVKAKREKQHIDTLMQSAEVNCITRGR